MGLKVKRVVAWVLCIAFLCSLTGCGGSESSTAKYKKEKPTIVCTIFPIYDWVREILGEHIDKYDVVLLADNGSDMHSFLPSVEDIACISSCDILICVGGESDRWLDDVVAERQNKDMVVVKLLDKLKSIAKVEEHKEGMQGEVEDEPEYDEHIWMSINIANICVHNISKELELFDKENLPYFKDNTKKYCEKLDNMSLQYKMVMDKRALNILIVADRFPFRYLVDDYGLDYFAAFAGCSAESEANFDTIIFLADKLKNTAIHDLIITETGDVSLAKTIIETSGLKNSEIFVLDSMQSVTKQDIDNGKTYLEILNSNLITLQKYVGYGIV